MRDSVLCDQYLIYILHFLLEYPVVFVVYHLGKSFSHRAIFPVFEQLLPVVRERSHR